MGRIPPSRYERAEREDEKEHRHTTTTHHHTSKSLRELPFSPGTKILHTIPTSGSRQAKRVASKPVVTAVFLFFPSWTRASARLKGWKEPEKSTFLLQNK